MAFSKCDQQSALLFVRTMNECALILVLCEEEQTSVLCEEEQTSITLKTQSILVWGGDEPASADAQQCFGGSKCARILTMVSCLLRAGPE